MGIACKARWQHIHIVILQPWGSPLRYAVIKQWVYMDVHRFKIIFFSFLDSQLATVLASRASVRTASGLHCNKNLLLHIHCLYD